MKVHAIGGYNQVGKNMTAVEVEDGIVLIDMGYDMEEVVEEDNEIEELNTKETIELGAIPDDSKIHDKKEKVKAIIIGHGHLDHVGAVPKLAGSYDCPILATPFTMSVLKRMVEQDKKNLNNKMIEMEPGDTYQASDSIEIEFVNITHSIPGAVMPVVHTDEGTLVYGLDNRLDDDPVLGEKPDYERMRELGEEGVKVFIGDSTRVDEPGRVMSESIVETELKHTIDQAYQDNGGVFITTFSSHIERLTSILKANDGRRKVALIGRSLKEYTNSAEELGMIDLSDVEVVSYWNETNELLEEISKERDEWLVVCTGHQGEPGAALTRMAKGEYPMEIQEGDNVIFSSSIIPSPLNRASRYRLDKMIKRAGGRVISEVHVSGHSKREDCRDLLLMLKPEKLIPSHGSTEMAAHHATLAREEGYTLNEDVFIVENGNTVDL